MSRYSNLATFAVLNKHKILVEKQVILAIIEKARDGCLLSNATLLALANLSIHTLATDHTPHQRK